MDSTLESKDAGEDVNEDEYEGGVNADEASSSR